MINLTNYYNVIMTSILIFGFAIAIGVLVAIRKATIKEEQRAEMASRARKIKKFEEAHKKR